MTDDEYIAAVMALPDGPRTAFEFHERAYYQLLGEQRACASIRRGALVSATLIAAAAVVMGFLTGHVDSGMGPGLGGSLFAAWTMRRMENRWEPMVRKAAKGMAYVPGPKPGNALEALAHVPLKNEGAERKESNLQLI